MKIVTIFAEKLYAFHYKGEADNELDRLLSLWNDTLYLYQFVTQNKNDTPKNKSTRALVEQIIENANEIDDTLIELTENKKRNLDEFFVALDNKEYRLDVLLSKQKGKKSYLRIYALKIDTNCYVITGGAIKFTHLMEERPHTKQELSKSEQCRQFLRKNDVIDFDSFYEFLNETK